MAILDADPANRITVFPAFDYQPSLERGGDRLSLATAMSVDSRHELAVYAKTPTRIRFEVRRLRRGRYGFPDTARTLDGRLLHILMIVARNDASRLVDWHSLFQFVDEPDSPAIGDLAGLMTAIFMVSNGSEELFRLLTDRLLIDGGVATGVDHRISDLVISRLVRAEVITKGRIRHRHAPSQIVRYHLVSAYEALRQRILFGFAQLDE